MAALMPQGKQQYFTAGGIPLVGGKVYTYAAGTTTPLATYTTAAADTPNANPVILDSRGEASIFFSAANYKIVVKDSLDSTIWTQDNLAGDAAGKLRTDLAASTGSANVGHISSGAGAVATTVQAVLRETVSIDNYDTLQNAINAAVGKTLLGTQGATYTVQDQLVIPSNIVIDFQGATIIDDVRTYRPPDQASRAKPLFYMYGVSGIKIRNFIYRSTGTRATVSDEVPTGIIWIGDNSTTGPGPTFDIEVSGIKASNLAANSLFVAVVGEAYNLHIHDIDITGDCSYGFNCEYGQAPTGTTDALAYGLHPHDMLIERFNGYNNSTSVGFLRTASCYNVTFSECYGRDVKSFIYTWTGDRSISRVSQNVKFKNCAHYASSTFLPGVVNYTVQLMSAGIDGSTGDPLPAWTNYDHLFTFENCQFQSNKVTYSADLRFYGTQGSAVFKSCIFRNGYYGVRAEPTTGSAYTSNSSLTFDDCVFMNNSRDVELNNITGVNFNHCKFKDPDENMIPVKLTNGANYNTFSKCRFSGLDADVSYIVIDSGCVFNDISNCIFLEGVNTPPLNLSAVTTGSGNVFRPQGLCVGGWSYFGVLGEPSSMYFSAGSLPDTFLDVHKRRHFCAETGGVSATINRLINGVTGDVVVFQAASTIATVTFGHLVGGVGTTERIITPAGANLTKTGTYWTVTLKSTPIGWILFE